MPVIGMILLGLAVFVLPSIIKATIENRKIEFEAQKAQRIEQEKQDSVRKIREDKAIVSSNERFGLQHGFFAVNKKNFAYFLSEDGSKVLGPYTKILAPFEEENGLAPVQIGNLVYYVDMNGEKVLGPFSEDSVYQIKYRGTSEGYATISIKRNKSLYDKVANIIMSKEGIVVCSVDRNNFVHGYKDGLISIDKEDGRYFVDVNGNNVLGPYEKSSWSYHTCFSEGLAVVSIDGDDWYINKEGKKVLGPYSIAYSFTNGIAMVKMKQQQGMACIDKQGNIIWGPNNDYHMMKYCPSEGCVILPRNYSTVAHHTLVNVKESKIIGGYEDCAWVKNGHTMVELEYRKKVIIDKNGNIVLDLAKLGYYSRYTNNSDNGWFSVQLINDKEKEDYYCIDYRGNMLTIKPELYSKVSHMPSCSTFSDKINPIIDAYKTLFPDDELDKHAEECAKSARIAFFGYDIFDKDAKPPVKEEEPNKPVRKTTYMPAQPQRVSDYYTSHGNYESNGTHVVGVRFPGQGSGYYNYFGDNKIYNLGDRVLVPTGNNGDQEGVVVFRKIYKPGEVLPYGGRLKHVIRKL